MARSTQTIKGRPWREAAISSPEWERVPLGKGLSIEMGEGSSIEMFVWNDLAYLCEGSSEYTFIDEDEMNLILSKKSQREKLKAAKSLFTLIKFLNPKRIFLVSAGSRTFTLEDIHSVMAK